MGFDYAMRDEKPVAKKWTAEEWLVIRLLMKRALARASERPEGETNNG